MEESATVGQRFLKLISHLGISKNAFAASLDKTATVIQHLVDERNKPGFDLLCKVFEVYPNVSKDWLLQGIGPMLTNDQNSLSDSTIEEHHAAASLVHSDNPTRNTAISQPTAPVDTPPVTQPVAVPPVAAKPHTEPEVAPAVAVSQMPTAAPAAALPTAAEAASIPVVAPAAVPADTSWQAALYTQQMAHQLAIAELRNQHLQDQQRLMQQMMDLMQRQLTR